METCYNHPERKAYSVCYNCGRHFCEDCLTAGNEYYYCKSPECQQKLREDTERESYREKVTCPNCQTILDLSPDKNYVQLLSSLNQGDIAIIKSMLDDAEVDYYLTGENFLAVRPLLEPAVFYVNEKDLELAKDILKDFELHLFGFSSNNEEE